MIFYVYKFDFSISAEAGDDYVAFIGERIVFPRGVDRVCHNVPILQDDECEIEQVKDFFSSLEYVSGDQLITIGPTSARIIIDDTNEPECGECVCGVSVHVKLKGDISL